MGYVPQLDPVIDAGPIEVDGTIDPRELVEGDLVFTSRPGLLQDLCNRAGEPWRHVGLVTDHHGERSITEVSRAKFDIRPMENVIAANDEVAIARVEPAARDRAAKAARWCRDHGRRAQIYAWHDVMLAGLIATARHYTVQSERDALHRAIEAAVSVVDSRLPLDESVTCYTCAAFIAESFARSGHRIDIELRVPRALDERPAIAEVLRGRTRPQLRAGRPAAREYAVLLYALLAGLAATRVSKPGVDADPHAKPGVLGSPAELDQYRWAMPGDLWRSPTIVERYLVIPTSAGHLHRPQRGGPDDDPLVAPSDGSRR